MGWGAAVVAAAVVIAGGVTAYSVDASGRKQAHATEDANKEQLAAEQREQARQRELQEQAKREAAEKERLLAEEKARVEAEAKAKEARSDQLRADALARQRAGRRSLLATGPSTWYSEPAVQRKTLLGM